ncbi:MAG: ATP-binding protein, partial [Nitrospirota bacterium]
MTLVDPEEGGSAVLWVRVIDGQSDHESQTYPCQFSDDHLAVMKAHPNYFIATASTLPSYLTSMQKPDLSLFVTFPIIVHEIVSGVLVLAYRRRQKPPADNLAHARRLADQVAVALAKNQAIKAQVQAQIELAGAVDAQQQAEERTAILQSANQSLKTKEERLRHQQSATLALVQDRTVFEGSLPSTAKQLTTVAAQALSVDRVSVWIFEDHTQSLYCLDSYDRPANRHAFVGKLVSAHYPIYFEALSRGDLLVASQAQQDANFQELVTGILAPQQIGARIDAPFQVQGQLIGVISIEHAGSSRDWAPDEQQFAQALANFMTLVLEAARRRESEEALALAKLTAEDATKAKAEFLVNMSHEIRTPMNGVIGMTEILARTPLSETQRHYVETIHNSGDTLLTLINDILDFSKIEAGKLEIQSVPIDLRDIVERTVEQLAERAQRKHLNLSVEYDPTPPTTVMGDPIRIRQILTNLLSNAIKFTQAGDVSVTVALDPSPSGEGSPRQIRLAVTDTGSGISAEGQAKLFQSFSQVDGSSTRVHGGTGLGLSICKQLSELMGGTIGVESTLGQGSTFWVVLPFSLQAGTVVENQADPALAGVRVCAAVNHPATRRLVTRYLSHWGIVPRMAATEAEFLELVMTELATDERRVIALVDETFADTTDTQLLEALASDSALQEIRILRLVSFIRRADVGQHLDGTHTHLVTKPVRYEAFRDALVSLFDKKLVAPQQTHHAQTTQSLSGHVLLAEDNPVNQEIALLMLETLGCSVTVAQNGREAVDQAQTTTYDLILMDCQMPELDGFEATRLIREWEQSNSRSATPIVALTAHATPGDREQCLAAGMNEYITKPFSMDHLRAVLTSWLQPAPTPSTVEQPAPQPTVTLVPAMPEPTCLHVDVKAWKSITSLQKPGKEDMLAKILTLYLADSQQLVDTLHQGMDAGDAAAVNLAAHSLKSRSAVLGARSLATLCQEFETLSHQGQLKEAEPLQDQLDAAFDHASQCFRAELNKRRAA